MRSPPRDASPYDCAARAEMQQRVAAALSALPEAFREVVVLREIEGFGYEEIAEILQVNLGTVKSRLTRGRAALREALVHNQQCCVQSEAPHGRNRLQAVTAMNSARFSTEPNHRPCEPCAAGFSAYLDGAISGVEMAAIAAHLDGCGECADRVCRSGVRCRARSPNSARRKPPRGCRPGCARPSRRSASAARYLPFCRASRAALAVQPCSHGPARQRRSGRGGRPRCRPWLDLRRAHRAGQRRPHGPPRRAALSVLAGAAAAHRHPARRPHRRRGDGR